MNILHLTNLKKEDIWKVIKKRRSENPLNRTCTSTATHGDISTNIMSDLEAVERDLQVQSNEYIYHNITEVNLREGAELFLYLYPCSDKLNPWIIFYSNLFEYQPTNHILLTINRILKSSNAHQKEELKTIAKKLLLKIHSFSSLNFLDYRGGAAYLYFISILIWPHFDTYPYISIQNSPL